CLRFCCLDADTVAHSFPTTTLFRSRRCPPHSRRSRTGCSRPTSSTAEWRIRCCSRSSPPRASAPWSRTPSSNPHRWATDTRQPRRTSMIDTHAQTKPASQAANAQAGDQAQTWRDDFSRVLSPVFGSPQLDLVRGQGSYVWDASGKKYLDLLAGIAVNALGHAHPAWTTAIAEQASTL